MNQFECLGTVDIFLKNRNLAKLTQQEIRRCVKHGDSGMATTQWPLQALAARSQGRLAITVSTFSHDTRRRAEWRQGCVGMAEGGPRSG